MEKYLVEKDWIYRDLRCVVIMTSMGHRCGYVGLSKTHFLYGVEYNEEIKISEEAKENFKKSDIGKRGILSIFCFDGETITPGVFFNVHGGITYAAGSGDYPVKSDLWWFGFDCAHAGDAKDLSILSEDIKEIELKYPLGGELRTLEYCIYECESLADQLLKF